MQRETADRRQARVTRTCRAVERSRSALQARVDRGCREFAFDADRRRRNRLTSCDASENGVTITQSTPEALLNSTSLNSHGCTPTGCSTPCSGTLSRTQSSTRRDPDTGLSRRTGRTVSSTSGLTVRRFHSIDGMSSVAGVEYATVPLKRSRTVADDVDRRELRRGSAPHNLGRRQHRDAGLCGAIRVLLASRKLPQRATTRVSLGRCIRRYNGVVSQNISLK